jgi:protein SCO1/2
MKHKKITARAALLVVLACVAQIAWSHEGHMHEHGAQAPAAAPAMTRPVKLSETQLLDQDGHKLRLASDAVGGKVVVVTFVYTNCADTCPMVSHTFSQIQEQLGALMEDRVRLLSLTVDPARDTPARLKEYAANFNPKRGWLWLTGEQANVTAAQQAFGITIRNPENHPAQILVGDPKSGRWTRIYEVDQPQQVLAKVNELLAAQRADKHAAQDGLARNGGATGMRITRTPKLGLAVSHGQADF